jgi:hypothetical protein
MNDTLLKNKEVKVALFADFERAFVNVRTPGIIKNTQIQKIPLK